MTTQDVIAKLSQWEKEIEVAKREKAQAEGRLQSSLKVLEENNVKEENAQKLLDNLITEYDKTLELIQSKLLELEKMYEM